MRLSAASIAVAKSGFFLVIVNKSVCLRACLIVAAMLMLPYVFAGQATAASVPRFAYAVNAYDSTLSIYSVDAASGRLRALGHVPVGKFPSSVVTHPSGRFVFVSAQTGMTVQAFAVDPASGRLREVQGSPFDPKVVSPFWLDLDSTGEFLFVVGRNSNAMAVMKVNAQTGALSNAEGSPVAGGYLPRSVKVHPNDKFVYMTNINDDSVSAYNIERKSGKASLVDGHAFEAGDAPQFMAFHPSGRYLYMSSWNSKSLLGYSVQPDSGVPALMFNEAMGEDVYPFGMDITPDGRFLYVASWFGGVTGFRVDGDTGKVSRLVNSPYQTFGDQPVQIYIEPTGHFAYVTNYESNHISSYRIDPNNGDLLPQDTMMARAGPRSMSFVMGDKPVRYEPGFLFAVDAQANQLFSFRVDAASGKLTQAHSVSTGEFPSDVSVDSLGHYVLVSNAKGNTISVYEFDPRSGKLKELQASPFPAGAGPAAVKVDYNGRYVYAINQQDNTLSAYYLDAASGVLDEAPKTPLFSASPYKVGESPAQLLLHPTDKFAYVFNRGSRSLNILKYYAYGPLVIEQTVPPSPIDLADDYRLVSFDGTGRFMYGINDAGTLTAFVVDPRTGAPKALSRGSLNGPSAPIGLAGHPEKPWVYVANASAASILHYGLVENTGVVTLQNTTELKAVPEAMSLEPSGRYIYVSLAKGAGIAVFAIDPASGQLRAVQTLPFKGALSAMTVSYRLY